MKKLFFLFIFLTSCSFQSTAKYWNDNLNNEVLDFNKDYNFKEYGTILEAYNDRTKYPNIN